MKKVLVYSDHGLMLANYLNTDLAKKITESGVQLTFLVESDLVDKLNKEYSQNKSISFISSREDLTHHYQLTYHAGLQEIIEYVRGASMSVKTPITYVDIHRQRKEYEAKGRWKYLLISMRPLIWLLRRSKIARRAFESMQEKLFTTNIFGDLFDEYKPDLIISTTAGWRLDRYFLREAKQRKIPTAITVIGWDNPCSHGLPGARVDYASVWSQIQIGELSKGLDWPVENLYVGGMPLYDGYLNNSWLLPRDDYFKEHNLDPDKKLIAYVATALSISPNFHNIEVLINIIKEKKLKQPAQLLIRLHPNHYKSQKHYQEEREKILEAVKGCPDVHVVAPKALGGGAPRYSGEDFPEKASMMAYCDVLVTIYSTMVLEAAIKDRPIISCCIDTEGWRDNYWIPLHEVPTLPTAARVEKAEAAVNAFTEEELINELDNYLEHPERHRENRANFVKDELTYLNGEATGKTAEYILSLLNKH